MKLITSLLTLLLVGCTSPTMGPTAPVGVIVPNDPSLGAPLVVAPTPPASRSLLAARASNPDELVLSKETLVAGKVTVPNGGVTIRKVITETSASQPVDLNVESCVIERSAPSGQTPDFSVKEISVVLTRENVTSGVSSQVVEIVKLGKVNSSQQGNAQATLRSESVEIVK